MQLALLLPLVDEGATFAEQNALPTDGMSGEEPSEVANWVKQRVLGSGGFGVVTLWKHKTKDEMLALKKCRWGTDQILTPKHKERWSKEVEIMQRLDHPNVVRAVAVPDELAAVLHSELPMLCMEFCSKGDLRQVLNRPENCCGLNEVEVRALISDVASAVKYLHYMKITHRDLKPENIVLQQTEQRISYKLIDLGYAKELDQSSICTSFVGTLQYLAPELFMSKNYTCSVDYWSLGLVSHEVMTGVRPFLPNMPPVSWMSHVSNKSSDDINAVQSPDGTIMFSKELFPQNHISSCLKYYMERWLKVCLEWDSRKRGRDFSVNRDGDIVVFHLIEDILSKAMLSVYNAAKYQSLSYEVDNSTAVSTLQRWIERDTGLSVADQELLLPDGSHVDVDKEAWLCISMQNPSRESMVYVYKKGSLSVPEVTPQIPSSVSAMMQDPRSLVPYAHQIRAYAHAVFFLNQERQLNVAFRQAAVVKLLQLSSSSMSLSQEIASVSGKLSQAEAQHQMNDTALQYDQQQALKCSLVSVNVVQCWKKSNATLRRQLDKLKEVTERLKVRSDSVLRKTHAIGNKSYLSSVEQDNLNTLVDAATKCYETLRKKPKDKRHQQMDSVDMVKVVYNCLKTRDKLLRDSNFNADLQQMVLIQSDVDKLWVPLRSCGEMVSRVQADLTTAFRERQTDIWTQVLQLSQQKTNGTSLVSPSNNNNLSQSQSTSIPNLSVWSRQSSHSSSSKHSSVDLPSPVETPLQTAPVLPVFRLGLSAQGVAPTVQNEDQNLNHVLQNKADSATDAMINDNIALRYATQDLMNESFLHYRSILNEDHSLDWNFMK